MLRVKANVDTLQPWHDTELKAGDCWEGCQLTKIVAEQMRRQSVFNLCESPIFFRPPHHNMPEISDGEQAPILAVFDRPSMKGPDLIVRCQPLCNLPERGYKGPPSL